MIRQFDNNVWMSRSQQTTGQVVMTFPQYYRQSRPVVIQHVHLNSRNPDRYYDEFDLMTREKQAATGRWVLQVITAREAKQAALKANKTHISSNKTNSFQSKISSKIEPIKSDSSHFTATPFNLSQSANPLSHRVIISARTISDDNGTPITSFSRTPSVDHTPITRRSNNPSDEYSTEDFRKNKHRKRVTKKVIIGCTILSIVLIIAIIIAVLVTIFVGRNQTSNTSSSSRNSRSLSISNSVCSNELFNLTDSLCQDQIPYQYYSCSQMTTSNSLTIRFVFQHDTVSGHWYFDDISAVQNANNELIINGGFETNFTGWKINTMEKSISDIYVNQGADLAHAGLGYLHIVSKYGSFYIEQTFNVTKGEYIHVSFWWRYSGELKVGYTCQATVQLILLS